MAQNVVNGAMIQCTFAVPPGVGTLTVLPYLQTVGYEAQRDEWEHQYALAQSRFEAHRKQVEEAQAAEAEAAVTEPQAENEPAPSTNNNAASNPGSDAATGGALASDEALAALREKLAGGGEN